MVVVGLYLWPWTLVLGGFFPSYIYIYIFGAKGD